MPLYGHELDEQTNPLDANLGFAVTLKDREFIGRDQIAAIAERGPDRLRVGLSMTGRKIARENYPIRHEDQVVGKVTSGTFSPSLNRPIAMGYVRHDLAQEGQTLDVEIRGSLETAKVVSLPFYKRKK